MVVITNYQGLRSSSDSYPSQVGMNMNTLLRQSRALCTYIHKKSCYHPKSKLHFHAILKHSCTFLMVVKVSLRLKKSLLKLPLRSLLHVVYASPCFFVLDSAVISNDNIKYNPRVQACLNAKEINRWVMIHNRVTRYAISCNHHHPQPQCWS